MYWFVPMEQVQFGTDVNPEFGIGNDSVKMQFYKNMRFSEKNISYNIFDDCPLKKKKGMETAFDIISNDTILTFYPIEKEGMISIVCEEKNKFNGGLFVAGEGGPTNITQSGNFSVILGGKILLIKGSDCQKPNVEIHELLHVLGFNHSANVNNILYPVSKCRQTIGGEIPKKINELYSIPSYPDLVVKDVGATLNKRYLNINITIQNEGLKKSDVSKITIYGDEKEINSFEMEELDIGSGAILSLTNIWISQIKLEKLAISIETDSKELSKQNNKVLLTKDNQ